MNGQELKEHLDKILTCMTEGFEFHTNVGAQINKIPARRGFARFHLDGEALEDAKKKVTLTKFCVDYLGHLPTIDYNYVSKVSQYKINSQEDFKNHFKVWNDREVIFLNVVKNAIRLASTESMELYKTLCCMQSDLEEEIFRLNLVYNTCNAAGWGDHDMRRISESLHHHFEHNTNIDFNIG